MRLLKPNVARMLRKENVDGLTKALGDRDPAIRAEAAKGLGKLIPVRSIGALCHAQEDSNTDVCEAAAQALRTSLSEPNWWYRVDKLAEIGRPAVPTLIWVLRRIPSENLHDYYEDWEARLRAVKALGKIGDKRAVEVLTEMLSCSGGVAGWHENVIKALAKLRDKSAVEPLLAFLAASYRDGHVDCNAHAVFVKFGEGKLADAVVDALRGEPARLRQLGDKRAIGALVHMLRACGLSTDCWRDWDVRKRVAEVKRYCEAGISALRALGAETTALNVFLQDLSSADDDTRLVAAVVLAAIGEKTAVRPLIAVLDDSRREVGQAAALALGVLGHDEAVKPLISRLTSGDAGWAHIEALGMLRDEEAIAPLLDCLKDFQYTDEYSLAAWEERACWALKALLQIGLPAATELGHFLDEEEPTYGSRFRTVLKSAAELSLHIGDTGDEPFVSVLRDRYEILKRTALENDLPRRALDRDVNAVYMLSVLGDFAVLPQLTQERDRLSKACKSEDTSHGGFTLWQSYGSFIRSVDEMAQRSKVSNSVRE